MEKNYLNIQSKNILNDVKNKIKFNNIYLKKEREIEIDEKMLEIIKSIILNDKDNIFEKEEIIKEKKKEINDSIMPSLMQYYIAIYNDNLDLLHKLLDENFRFGDYKYAEMELFILDKRISSRFDLDEYVKLLKRNLNLFKMFYRSLNCNINNNEIDLNQIIEKFANIIKKDNDIAISKKSINDRYNDLLRVEILLNFTEEEILNLNDNQKEILNRNFLDEKNEKTKIILNLIKKYNYSKNLIFWSEFFNFFTEEEILNLSDEDIELIQKIFTCNHEYEEPKKLEEIAINKFKEIKKINPNFNTKLDCFTYNALSIEQIMKMSDSCAKSINNICTDFKIHHIKNNFNIEISERILKKWIKEEYYKDTIKRNVKKLVKTK